MQKHGKVDLTTIRTSQRSQGASFPKQCLPPPGTSPQNLGVLQVQIT